MELPTILSLCDKSGIMVEPWARAGFPCIVVDVQHPAGVSWSNGIQRVGVDLLSGWLPPLVSYGAVFSFPPCTHLAVSGARWFKDKGLKALVEGLQLVERCRAICEWSGAPWFLENPVGQISSYWRKPDAYFDPCDYGGYLEPAGDKYLKKTCLWYGGGFVLPQLKRVEVEGNSPIHWAIPGPERSDFRSLTPAGFAQAVFEANIDAVLQKQEAKFMSTNAAVEGPDTRQRIACVMCAMEFVSHHEYERPPVGIPANTCAWCFYRSGGALYRRFNLLYEGLKVLSETHVEVEVECPCKGCQTLTAARAVVG